MCIRYTGPAPDLVLIVPPLMRDAVIQDFVDENLVPGTRWGNTGTKGEIPVWCCQDLKPNEIHVRCAREDDISGEFGTVYER